MLQLEARVHSQASPSRFCSGQSGSGQGFLGEFRLFSVAVIPSVLHTRI